jgi:dihydropteroate synthase
MQINPQYKDVVSEIFMFYKHKLNKLKSLGLNDVIIDPGFGFGKTVSHNFELLNKLEIFTIFEHVILAGLSRKSMLYKTIGGGPEDALSATAAANMVALQKGAKILRVHDVKEAWDVIRIYEALQDNR